MPTSWSNYLDKNMLVRRYQNETKYFSKVFCFKKEIHVLFLLYIIFHILSPHPSFLFCWSFYVFSISLQILQNSLDCLGKDYHSRIKERKKILQKKKSNRVFFPGFKLAMLCIIAEKLINCAILRHDVPKFFFLGKMLHT